jgi:hypothetical protein
MIKQIVIFFIFILTLVILYRLFQKRQHLSQENFTASIPTTSSPLKIQSISSANSNMPLIEYCIKASYNSAYDGANVSLLALDNVISRGCRFLDFEIYSVDGSPSVAYSVDPTFSSLTSRNTLLLKNVFNEIIGNCFTGNAPNPRDPLFIHLRINTNCGLSNQSACNIYQQVAGVIQSTLLPRLYLDNSGNPIPVSNNTLLSDIAGKIVLVMDASINRDYKNYAICDASNNETCYNLRQYINIETGGTAWKKFKFSDFLNQTKNTLTVDSNNSMMAEPNTGTLSLQLVLPDTGVNVQNASFPLSNIVSYGCQTIALKFYNNDLGLKAYEAMFNNYNTAFVPLGFAVQYIIEENK